MAKISKFKKEILNILFNIIQINISHSSYKVTSSNFFMQLIMSCSCWKLVGHRSGKKKFWHRSGLKFTKIQTLPYFLLSFCFQSTRKCLFQLIWQLWLIHWNVLLFDHWGQFMFMLNIIVICCDWAEHLFHCARIFLWKGSRYFTGYQMSSRLVVKSLPSCGHRLIFSHWAAFCF